MGPLSDFMPWQCVKMESNVLPPSVFERQVNTMFISVISFYRYTF